MLNTSLIASIDQYIASERSNAVNSVLYVSHKRRSRQSGKDHMSWGIACFHKFKDGLKLLVVNKRATYAYSWFVRGKYPSVDFKSLRVLFDQFTADEKYTLLSMKFDLIWYRAYSSSMYRNEYLLAARRFNNAFCTESGKKLLYRLINETKVSSGIWELPKGRANDGENGIDCATREFTEETAIPRESISIISDTKIMYNTTSAGGNKFNVCAYAAILKDPSLTRCSIKFSNVEQLCEISDMKWVTMAELKNLNINGLTNILEMFTNVKSYLKKNYMTIA